jgi:hypothetical protein
MSDIISRYYRKVPRRVEARRFPPTIFGYRECGFCFERSPPRMAKVDPESLTTKQLAELFDVSAQTIRNWVREGCPQSGDGTFDFSRVIIWRERSLLERSKGN